MPLQLPYWCLAHLGLMNCVHHVLTVQGPWIHSLGRACEYRRTDVIVQPASLSVCNILLTLEFATLRALEGKTAHYASAAAGNELKLLMCKYCTTKYTCILCFTWRTIVALSILIHTGVLWTDYIFHAENTAKLVLENCRKLEWKSTAFPDWLGTPLTRNGMPTISYSIMFNHAMP